jgi:hypothetical protein
MSIDAWKYGHYRVVFTGEGLHETNVIKYGKNSMNIDIMKINYFHKL